jgi:tripartite-type tricarboxylate transporter receptor subunit TctC
LLQIGAHNAGAYGRPFVLPPGTPRDRVQLLRRAFQETLKDREFLAEADKTKLNIEPMTGEELEKLIGELYTLDAALIGRLKDVLYN